MKASLSFQAKQVQNKFQFENKAIKSSKMTLEL